VKIVARVILWLEAAARIWAAYWLLILGGFFFCGSLILRWVNFPLSRSVNGIQLPFGSNLELVPRYHFFSYGVCAAIVLAAGFVAYRRWRFSLVVAASILATIFLAVPCKLAFEQPSLLHRVDSEANNVAMARSFTREYLPENYGYLEDIPGTVQLNTALGRLLTTLSFLGLGWLCFGVGSTLITFYAFGRATGKRMVGAISFCLPLAIVSIFLVRPLIGQNRFIQARIAQAQGENERAIARYRKAILWEKWFAEDINIYATIGDLQRQANLAQGSPERRVKRAIDFEQAGNFELALFELDQATSTDGKLGLTARRESARVQADYGLALYRAGAVGSAIVNWEQSLAKNAAQTHVLIFLARGNYDIAHYTEALDADKKVINSVGLISLLVNAYSLAGDCYTRIGDDDKARQYYTLSIRLDNDINFWATSGLVGN
jgi:Tetratricopeptide repeat